MEQEQNLKILMLEDNEDDVVLIEQTLRKERLSFIHQHVENREEFCEAIESFKPDIVLSDNGLPSFNSLDALGICLATKTPFVLVSGVLSEELVNCLRKGASDYVLKSNLSRLPGVIRSTVEKHRIENDRHSRRIFARVREIRKNIFRSFFKPSSRFKVNEAVQHISGGPLMVVSGFDYDSGKELHIICQWYEREKRITLRKEFPEHELKNFNWNNTEAD